MPGVDVVRLSRVVLDSRKHETIVWALTVGRNHSEAYILALRIGIDKF